MNSPNHWEKVGELERDELLVIYAKYVGREPQDGSAVKAIQALKQMFRGDFRIDRKGLIDTRIKAKKIVTKEEVKKRKTPKYSVQVTNELFHNGNVEAWKNIIESYEVAYQGLRVLVFHGGEFINDINSLFKWGKVKHGDCIFFQVAGDNIQKVSKFQRYLFEGASPRFEFFLKRDINKILNLF